MKQTILKIIKKIKRISLDDLIILSELDEKEIRPILDELLEEKMIFKISSFEYAYLKTAISQENLPPEQSEIKQEKGYKKVIPLNINTNNMFIKQNEEDIFINAPDYAKPYLIKYITALKLARNLKGRALKAFLAEFSNKYPNYQISYSQYIKIKSKYVKYGLKGLIPKYGNSKGRTVVLDDLYNKFKELYLNADKYSIRKCVEIIKQEHPKRTIPSHTSFRRRLEREYSIDVIRQLREINLNLPSLEKLDKN